MLPIARSLLNSKKVLVITTGILCLGGSVGFMAFGKQLGDFGNAVASTVLQREVATPRYRYAIAQQYTYRFDYQNHSKSDLRVLFGESERRSAGGSETANSLASDFLTNMRGEVVATVVDRVGENYRVLYHFSNTIAEIRSRGDLVAAQSRLITEDLRKDLVVTISANGQIISIQFAPNVAEISQNFVRSLLSNLQFISPSTATDKIKEWNVTEEDTNGKYIARYQGKASFGNNLELSEFQKNKVRYLTATVPTGNTNERYSGEVTIIPQGDWQASFDRQRGLLIKLIGKETQKISVTGKEVGTSQTELNLNFVSINNLDSAAIEREKKAISPQLSQRAIALSDKPSAAETEAQIQRRELGNATLATLMADLATAEANPDPQRDYNSLYLKIKALIYLQPQVSQTIGTKLTAAKLNGLSFQLLSSALGSVGNDLSQAALTNAILARSNDPQAVISLIPNLSGVAKPTVATANAMEKLATTQQDPQVVTTAQLALGTIVGKMTAGDPQRITHGFIRSLQNATTTEERRHYLLVIGNIGSKDILGIVSQYSSHSDPIVRAAAATAFRNIADSSAETRLIELLDRDPDDSVRLEAAVALGVRSLNEANYKANKAAFARPSDAKVRLATLNNLWQARITYPEVIGIVKAAAEGDLDEDVKKAAASLMTQQ